MTISVGKTLTGEIKDGPECSGCAFLSWDGCFLWEKYSWECPGKEVATITV